MPNTYLLEKQKVKQMNRQMRALSNCRHVHLELTVPTMVLVADRDIAKESNNNSNNDSDNCKHYQKLNCMPRQKLRALSFKE